MRLRRDIRAGTTVVESAIVYPATFLLLLGLVAVSSPLLAQILAGLPIARECPVKLTQRRRRFRVGGVYCTQAQCKPSLR